MDEDKSKSKWGIGIFLLYGGFVLLMLIIIMFVSIQKFDLVDENYYQKELAYQDQIDRISRTNLLRDSIVVDLSAATGNVLIKFPNVENNEVTGTMKFFRPSNANLDFELPIQLDSLSIQEIDAEKVTRGYWVIKIYWAADLIEYYSEIPFIVN